MTAKLCVLAIALAWIARARVAVLPGWVVPVPALILAAIAALSAVAVVVGLKLRRPPHRARHARRRPLPITAGRLP